MTACEPPPGWKRLDAIWCALVFLILGAVYLASPVPQCTDSHHTLLLSETLLKRGTFDMNDPVNEGVLRDSYVISKRVPGKFFPHYPPGSAVLSMPMVAVANALGWSVLDDQGRISRQREEKGQRVLAGLVTAATGVMIFVLGRQFLPAAWSVVLALALGLGTQLYSTSSRALWSDTWGGLMFSVVLWLLLAWRKSQPPWLLLGTLLGWLFITRPTYSLHIVLIGSYVLFFHRQIVWKVAGVSLFWLGVFMTWSWTTYGTLQPPYYRQGAGAGWSGFVENVGVWWISPSRGLFTMVPVTIWIAAVVVAFWKRLPERRFMVLAVVAVVLHSMLVSAYQTEFGGHSYGSRLMASLVPWIAVLTAAGLCALLRSGRRTAWLGAGAVFLAASIFVQWRGANAPATWAWNYRPVDICLNREHGWNWRYPQWIAGLVPLPDDYVAMLPSWQGRGRLNLDQPEAKPFLKSGWSSAEPGFRWNEGREATLVFQGAPGEPGGVRMKLSSLGRQRIEVELNGVRLPDMHVGEWRTRVLRFPPGVVQGRNELRFQLPDARQPQGAPGADKRELGLCVAWVEFLDATAMKGLKR